jgi:hypothetical protein
LALRSWDVPFPKRGLNAKRRKPLLYVLNLEIIFDDMLISSYSNMKRCMAPHRHQHNHHQ